MDMATGAPQLLPLAAWVLHPAWGARHPCHQQHQLQAASAAMEVRGAAAALAGTPFLTLRIPVVPLVGSAAAGVALAGSGIESVMAALIVIGNARAGTAVMSGTGIGSARGSGTVPGVVHRQCLAGIGGLLHLLSDGR